MIEYACKDIVFHFNKKHLEDETIPMWVVKTKGESFYVNHVECTVPWSTKETPDNAATKGSIKVKDCLLTIDEGNCARVTRLTAHDKIRLHNVSKGITRIIWYDMDRNAMTTAINHNNIKHAAFKRVGGSCGVQYMVTDILTKSELNMLTLAMGDKFRVLMPNERFYSDYDDPNHDPDWYEKMETQEYANED